MKTRLLVATVAVALAPMTQSALAQDAYDGSKPCRSYLVTHLPAPGRCAVELFGSFGPHMLIKDGLIFRSQDEYRQWQSQQAKAPAPQSPAQASQALLCPAELRLTLTASAIPAGWHSEAQEATARLDPTNPPHTSGTILTCYYAVGALRGAVMLNRPSGDLQCTARPDGFDCHP